MPSLAPVSIAGMTGMPGQSLVVLAVTAAITVGSIGVYGVATGCFISVSGDLGIGEHLFERAFDVGRFVDGQQAAVDDGGGELRESILGVAAGEHGRHAGGAHLRVVERDGGEARDGAGVVRILHHGLQVGAELAAVDIGGALEGGARDIEEVDGKIELGEAREAVGQMVDGVVPRGQRTVSAAVGDFELEAEEDLLRGLHRQVEALAVLDVAAAGIGIHAELRVDQIAMLLDQPIDPVGVPPSSSEVSARIRSRAGWKFSRFMRRKAATRVASSPFMSEVPRP